MSVVFVVGVVFIINKRKNLQRIYVQGYDRLLWCVVRVVVYSCDTHICMYGLE